MYRILKQYNRAVFVVVLVFFLLFETILKWITVQPLQYPWQFLWIFIISIFCYSCCVYDSGLAIIILNIISMLTYSSVQCPSWEANGFAASQEIPRISRNPKVHYRTHKHVFCQLRFKIRVSINNRTTIIASFYLLISF